MKKVQKTYNVKLYVNVYIHYIFTIWWHIVLLHHLMATFKKNIKKLIILIFQVENFNRNLYDIRDKMNLKMYFYNTDNVHILINLNSRK